MSDLRDDLCYLTIAKAAEMIKGRQISPVELVDAYLKRIEAINPQLDAYITVTEKLARDQARTAEAEISSGHYRGPLHGIPFALKDMFDTAGIRTTSHSKVLLENVPQRDAKVVRQLYQAGAILLGKLAMHEFAHGGPSFDLPWPPARNPWNPMHFTGGSSSGSAAAVAAGLAMFALGSDTGGSIRSPSWLCGIAGLKPSFGLISRAGTIPFSESCDHVGPMAWTVEDCAILLECLAAYDPQDSGSARTVLGPLRSGLNQDIRGMRIGVVRHFSEEDIEVSPELSEAVDSAIRTLQDLGAIVETVKLRSLHDYYAVRLMLTESEIYALHQSSLQERMGDYGHHFLSRCLPACLYTSADYITAQRQRAIIINEMRDVYTRHDALLTAGAGPAPSLLSHKSMGSVDKFLRPGMGTLFSVTGAPALALCAGFSKSGLPLGIQLAGRPFEDATVLRLGHAYEQATNWRQQRPRLVPGRAAPAIHTTITEESRIEVDQCTRNSIEVMASRAGFKLSPTHLNLLLETAPYGLELVKRLNRNLPWDQGQASVFSLQREHHPAAEGD